MPDIDATIIFFGTLLYVIAILIGFFIINELRESNKNFKNFMTLFSHFAFLSASRESANKKAKQIQANAFEILSDQFPEELRQVVAAERRVPHRNGVKEKKQTEFEGLPLNDLL